MTVSVLKSTSCACVCVCIIRVNNVELTENESYLMLLCCCVQAGSIISCPSCINADCTKKVDKGRGPNTAQTVLRMFKTSLSILNQITLIYWLCSKDIGKVCNKNLTLILHPCVVIDQ